MVFSLAQFLGQHRDPDQCFAKLNEAYHAGEHSRNPVGCHDGGPRSPR